MINFIKMHALGNDFVIIDNTNKGIVLTPQQIYTICDRKEGVGCDQLIITEDVSPKELVKITIYNADGSLAEACGNASRCVAWYAMNKYQVQEIKIKTCNRLLEATMGDGVISINMGTPLFQPESIPLSDGVFAEGSPYLIFAESELKDLRGVPVNVGNPHIVFIVPELSGIDVATLGKMVEHHGYFPQKTNVEFIQVLNPHCIKMKVWERGTGITKACGTGACASFAVASSLNIVESENVTVQLDGGNLTLGYDAQKNIILTGSATFVFEGKIYNSALVNEVN